MPARMTNPAYLLDPARDGISALIKAAQSAGVEPSTLELVHLRVSQINGCGPCVDSGARGALKNGETVERLMAVAAWRECEYFSPAERAALALAEEATRLADRPEPVPDAVWAAAVEHFTEQQLAGLVLWIATTNFFNRLNVTTRQPAPQAW